MSQAWETTLFACCSDCGICFKGWCCAPCLFGENSVAVGSGGCCVPCCMFMLCPCCIGARQRKQIREKYALPEQPW